MICRTLRAQAEHGLLASVFSHIINAPTGLQGSLYFSGAVILPKHFIPLEDFFPCWIPGYASPSFPWGSI